VNRPRLTLAVASAGGERTPLLRLLDARAAGGADETALRELARAASARTGAPFTSRSYRFPFALVAAHSAAVGVDIERVEPCDVAFADSICTPAELSSARPSQAEDHDRYFTSLWSSKEALSKALGDALAYDPRRLEGPGAWPDGRSGPWRATPLDVPDGYVAWLCWKELS
jgi:4'-phosphopantetheinyl transferase superfamily